MNKYLPSKKVLAFLGVVFVIFSIIFIFKRFQNRVSTYIPNINKEEITEEIISLDSDGDGLKDWEEVLWKTDPNNPDTDEDGTSDNDEISLNRNPLIAGPNDEITENKNNIQKLTSDLRSNTGLNQTDIFAQELFIGYLALKQENKLGTEDQDKLIQAIVGKNIQSNNKENYFIEDLILVSDNQDNRQKYADELKNMFSKLSSDMRSDIIILKEALDKDDIKILKEAEENIIVYTNLMSILLNMETPFDLGSLNLQIINLLSNIIIDTKKMKAVFIDPISALIASQQYIEDENKLIMTFSEIGVYFNENNIDY
ncbi:MAG: hypothetical protein KAR54_01270 [Candidatus Pacebacteria bacterium]|nr:hypothetical protein [Candidatus Paceibacterota bacterium]